VTLTPRSLEVREWTVPEWQAGEAQWNALLANSGLDPLFLSWQWMHTWWRFFAPVSANCACILAAYRGTELVGIAPLYRLRARRSSMPVRSLQFIGISWRDPEGMISEYLDFITTPAEREQVRTEFLRYLVAQGGWSELVVSFTSAESQWIRAFTENRETQTCYWRVVERATSYQADLRLGFPWYLANLGQSTRRSLWNLRRRVGAPDSVRLEQVTGAAIDEAFADLNRLHVLRWGLVAFSGNRLRFHLALARELVQRGELRMTRLRVGEQVVSVLYDIAKGARQYNIKMAFDPAAERGFSLGLIHFGFALEAAAERGVLLYDFLAGRGQRTDYKSHLGQLRDELATVQLLKGPFLQRLYRWYDSRKHKACA